MFLLWVVSMIFVDDREGSKELVDLVTDGILTRLEFGDAFFIGNGPDGDVDVGIERKRIGDLVNSISTGRLSGHQIPGLIKTYNKVYLIVEGVWRGNPTNGELQVESGRARNWRELDRGGRTFSFNGIWAYLCTLEEMTGVKVRITRHINDTCATVEAMYRWWSKPWKSHKGHLQMHKIGIPAPTFNVEKPSLVRRIAAELKYVGWQRSLLVEKHFPTVEAMMDSPMEEWLKIEGFGKITAESAWRELHE